MAEKNPNQEKEEKPQQAEPEAKTESEKAAPAKGKSGLFVWLILGAVIVAGSTGGFALSQLMGGTAVSDSNTVQRPAPTAKAFDPLVSDGASQKSWIYDKLDPIVANLDEPGVTRYIRITVILEMSPKMDPVKGQVFLDEKKVLMQDWLTTYLAGLSLENVRGSRSLNRIKREVLDQFNRLLFGQDKSYVDRVLFKEFAIQ
jgi:flagellar basal body-associated protein FliL